MVSISETSDDEYGFFLPWPFTSFFQIASSAGFVMDSDAVLTDARLPLILQSMHQSTNCGNCCDFNFTFDHLSATHTTSVRRSFGSKGSDTPRQ